MKNYILEMILKQKRHYVLVAAIWLTAIGWTAQSFGQQNNAIIKAVLNGTEYGFNAETGCLESIVHPVAGNLLKGTGKSAGLIDMAFPLGEFEILRISSKYSKGAQITVSDGKVEILYEDLGKNFPEYTVDGAIKVKVTLREAPDGVSVILTAKVENASSNRIWQVLFPDIDGIPPVEGADNMFFTSCGYRNQPFHDLKTPKYGISFYCNTNNPSVTGKWLYSGGLQQSEMLGRWYDIGGYRGGISLYERKWGWQERTAFWQKLDQKSELLRIAVVYDIDIHPGATWESCEYWLTPHSYGWSEGVKPYAQWVSENVKRVVPVPKHVREGMGFRTLWMAEQYIEIPSSTVWKFDDLASLAKESKEHGIDEMVLWQFAAPYVPFTKERVHDALGGHEGFRAAVAEGKKTGVNIVPFVSWMSIWGKENCERFGLKPGPTSQSYCQHTMLIPNFRPRYGLMYTCQWIDQNNELWQQDIRNSFAAFLELGVSSISWDQFRLEQGKEKGIPQLTEEYRKAVSAINSESTFSGESMGSLENESHYLDYTWNWFYYHRDILNDKRDLRGFTSVFPSPRINVNIDSDPMAVRYCFMDNLYMNLFTSQAGGVNGSARFSEKPELSAALKQCAALRKQFLPYFVDGRLVGDCVLTRHCGDAHISAYHLADKILIIVLRDSDEKTQTKKINLEYDLSCWLGSGAVTMKTYDPYGKQVAKKQSAAKGKLAFNMEYGELSIVEMIL